MSLSIISHKLICKKCDKNISNENYAKLRNYFDFNDLSAFLTKITPKLILNVAQHD